VESSQSVQGSTLTERCQKIELLLMDVDGVLTDGSIIYADNDVEIKSFHVRDGSGLKLWKLEGHRSGIITGRSSRVVDVRAAELDVEFVIQGARDKLDAYREVLKQTDLKTEQVCFIGDDVPDLPILRNCGLAVTVADACVDVMADCHYVTRSGGGRGAVREVIELILRCQDRWQHILERYRKQMLTG